MQRDKDPKLFFARAGGKFCVLSQMAIHNSDREVVRTLKHRLPFEFYDVE